MSDTLQANLRSWFLSERTQAVRRNGSCSTLFTSPCGSSISDANAEVSSAKGMPFGALLLTRLVCGYSFPSKGVLVPRDHFEMCGITTGAISTQVVYRFPVSDLRGDIAWDQRPHEAMDSTGLGPLPYAGAGDAVSMGVFRSRPLPASGIGIVAGLQDAHGERARGGDIRANHLFRKILWEIHEFAQSVQDVCG